MNIHVNGNNNRVAGRDYYELVLTPEAMLLLMQLMRIWLRKP
ncbi:hypothetical protein [Zobellella denitrificans]|nr:hypothetical protein [Zobellella denitrificans]